VRKRKEELNSSRRKEKIALRTFSGKRELHATIAGKSNKKKGRINMALLTAADKNAK